LAIGHRPELVGFPGDIFYGKKTGGHRACWSAHDFDVPEQGYRESRALCTPMIRLGVILRSVGRFSTSEFLGQKFGGHDRMDRAHDFDIDIVQGNVAK